MKKRHLCSLSAMLLIIISLVACQRQGGITRSYTESQRLQLDTSAVRSKNIDSLTVLVNRYKRSKERDKEIKRLNELNEFLEEASAFFAASRRKSGRGND